MSGTAYMAGYGTGVAYSVGLTASAGAELQAARATAIEADAGIFTADGKLTADAIKNSKNIIPRSKLGNEAISQGFDKYTTPTYQTPSGPAQTHFYMNPNTSEVYYGLDYKSILLKN